jgi:hypothetical protein
MINEIQVQCLLCRPSEHDPWFSSTASFFWNHLCSSWSGHEAQEVIAAMMRRGPQKNGSSLETLMIEKNWHLRFIILKHESYKNL